MTTETIIRCDNPSCATELTTDDDGIDFSTSDWRWLTIQAEIDSDGHAEESSGHACSLACVGPAAAALAEEFEPDVVELRAASARKDTA